MFTPCHVIPVLAALTLMLQISFLIMVVTDKPHPSWAALSKKHRAWDERAKWYREHPNYSRYGNNREWQEQVDALDRKVHETSAEYYRCFNEC